MNWSQPGITYLNSLAEWKGQGGFDRENIAKVLRHFGDPQNSVKSIHVAGTNGKGSVSTAVSSILGAAGYKVGLNTSPHLSKVNERIVVDGLPISTEVLDELSLDLKQACLKLGVELSFFEACTALAFMGFRDLKLDWMVIETGLGGRLDATNLISRPKVCCIVSIGMDHTDILGETLLDIAREKAGIIKHETQVVIGKVDPEVQKFLEQVCVDMSATAYIFNRDFYVMPSSQQEFVFHESSEDEFMLTSTLRGEHQQHNMALAVKCAMLTGIEKSDCRNGIKGVFWPGRLEQINLARRVYLDAAHNVDGVGELLNYIKSQGYLKIDVGFGVVSSKNWREMVNMLLPYVASWNLLTPDTERALSNTDLESYLSSVGVSAKRYDHDYDSFMSEVVMGSSETPLFVFGSIYLMGKVRAKLIPGEIRYWSRQNI